MTRLVAGWSVVQVMVAEVAVREAAVTAEIVGAGRADVVKLALADVLDRLALFAETTSKL